MTQVKLNLVLVWAVLNLVEDEFKFADAADDDAADDDAADDDDADEMMMLTQMMMLAMMMLVTELKQFTPHQMAESLQT
jgi:hypothetical protein